MPRKTAKKLTAQEKKYILDNLGKRSKKTIINNIGDHAKSFINKYSKVQVELVRSNNFNKKFFSNFRGAWMFDLIENRGRTGHGDRPSYFAVFLNRNSKWVHGQGCNSRDSRTLDRIYERFRQVCLSMKYPINEIRSDGEPGFNPRGVNHVKIPSQGADHRRYSLIDNFAMHLRRVTGNGKNYANRNEYKAITDNEFATFLHDWNNQNVQSFKCTRNEMMRSEDLENSYIAYCLYHNEDVQHKRDEMFSAGEEVKIRNLDDDPFKHNQLAPRRYTIKYMNNGRVQVEDEYGNMREVNYNDIKSKVRRNIYNFTDQEKQELHNSPALVFNGVYKDYYKAEPLPAHVQQVHKNTVNRRNRHEVKELIKAEDPGISKKARESENHFTRQAIRQAQLQNEQLFQMGFIGPTTVEGQIEQVEKIKDEEKLKQNANDIILEKKKAIGLRENRVKEYLKLLKQAMIHNFRSLGMNEQRAILNQLKAIISMKSK